MENLTTTGATNCWGYFVFLSAKGGTLVYGAFRKVILADLRLIHPGKYSFCFTGFSGGKYEKRKSH